MVQPRARLRHEPLLLGIPDGDGRVRSGHGGAMRGARLVA